MKIANINELKDGVQEVFVGYHKLFVCKNGSAIKVYSSVCPHQGAILHCDCVNRDLYCHTERSEVSKNKNAILDNPLDSSASPKNDKNVDSTEIYCKVHNWRFDCVSGEAINVENARLSEVAFEIDTAGNICIDSVSHNKTTEYNADSMVSNLIIPPPPAVKNHSI